MIYIVVFPADPSDQEVDRLTFVCVLVEELDDSGHGTVLFLDEEQLGFFTSNHVVDVQIDVLELNLVRNEIFF
jgi:hypothetical protein